MPSRFEGEFFVSRGPDIWHEDGLWHVGYQISPDTKFNVVLTNHEFAKALKRANRLLAEFNSSRTVIPVEFDSKFERVFDPAKAGSGEH